jgi:GntR family transcriptional regulator
MPAVDHLDRSGVESLHEQLSGRLRDFAQASERGTRLPSEEQLVQQYAVSRVTVRRAVDTLVDEGLLVRRQGLGTFVGPQRIQSLDRLRPFVDAFADDSDVEALLISLDWAPSASLPDAFGGPDGRVLSFLRLYVSEGVPHALIRVNLPEHIGRRITRAQLEAGPIYHVLQNDLKLSLRDARIDVTSDVADADVAARLEVPTGSHLLVLDRLTTDQHGVPVETSRHYLRPDAYRLRVTVAGGVLPEVIRLPGSEEPI